MNKYLFGLTAASILAISSSAHAFTSTASGGGFVSLGSITFSGKVTDVSPKWEWEIPTASDSSLKNIAVNELSGTRNGTNTEYVLVSSAVEFLHGRMQSFAATGGSGLSPTLTFGSDVIDTNNAQTFTVSTDVTGVQIVLDVDKHMTTIRNNGTGDYIDANTATAVTIFNALIPDQTTWTSPSVNSSQNINQLYSQLANPSSQKIQATYGLSTSNVKMIVPDSTAAFSSWTASIPLGVTIN